MRFAAAILRLMLVDRVATVIKEVAAAEVMPRFRLLADSEVSEKSPGDYVTIADQECERVLAQRLRELRDVPVVGEEATAADPALLDLVHDSPAVWVVDPIDGTSNFVAGSTDFVVMVSLIESGDTTHAWVWHPESESMLAAVSGEGTRRNSEPVRRDSARAGCGILKRKYMPEPARSRLVELSPGVGSVTTAHGSAGIEYAALIDGEIDFLLYWRTLPWDHSPGGLLATEAGLKVARVDGSPYRPGDGQNGLLAALPDVWDHVADDIQASFAP